MSVSISVSLSDTCKFTHTHTQTHTHIYIRTQMCFSAVAPSVSITVEEVRDAGIPAVSDAHPRRQLSLRVFRRFERDSGMEKPSMPRRESHVADNVMNWIASKLSLFQPIEIGDGEGNVEAERVGE